ncbi:3-keto-disaccharide hydrolase [Siphonobacter sp.]|uniref:3-keto-disaccharide hydrolase n=1 Tax=Siphonobacter sp. TaxID=1869184 RepID=UPI003B3B9CEF
MKRLPLLLVVWSFAGLTSATPPQGKGSWKSLFDGKSLKGWKVAEGSASGKARYEIKNGEIIGISQTNTANTFLLTEQQYGDFIFECDVKVDNSLNSGIQFRSLQRENDGRVYGYQMEIDPSDRSWSGGIYDEARRGWLAMPTNYEAGKKAFKRGEWNKYRIEAIGNSLRTFVNGIPVSNVVDDQTLKGYIALQVHSIGKDDSKEGKTIQWKNIRIQTENLQPSPVDQAPVVNLVPNTLTEQEKAQGFKLLFDGKTSTGWRGAYKTAFPEKGWTIKDGVLSVDKGDGAESTNGGDIVTNDSYGAFELTFQFKLTEGANSGMKYFVKEWLPYTHEFKPGQPMTVPDGYVKKGSAIGLEFQVLDDARHPDAKLGAAGNRTIGSLYDLIPADKTGANKAAVKPIGEWNEGRVIVYPNNHVEHWLNGFKVVEYDRGSPLFKALVERSKYASYKGFGMAEKGPILIQDHGDVVSFRSIKIRELK